jgi:AcrR family transcriptional regulator
MATNRRFHEITLDEVAEAAGIGKGTIYRYFADKDELFFQVATSGFEELCELLKQTVPCDTSFTEKLLNACKQITRFFAASLHPAGQAIAIKNRCPGLLCYADIGTNR